MNKEEAYLHKLGFLVYPRGELFEKQLTRAGTLVIEKCMTDETKYDTYYSKWNEQQRYAKVTMIAMGVDLATATEKAIEFEHRMVEYINNLKKNKGKPQLKKSHEKPKQSQWYSKEQQTEWLRMRKEFEKSKGDDSH